MVLPDRDAQQLNHALDAPLAHSNYDTTGPVGDLVGTFHRLQAMNAQTTADITLKSDIWSTMMNAPSVTASGEMRLPVGPPTTDLVAPLHPPKLRHQRHTPIWLSAAAVFLIATLVAGMYLPGRQPGNERHPTILAPQSAQVSYLGPNIAECTTQPRQPGTVKALAGQQATVRPFLPRSGFDPAFESIDQPRLRSNTVDGSVVLAQTTELATIDSGITTLLSQLFACAPYGLPVAQYQYLDSQYYALFTDDFFRREFSGYLEAGLEPRLTGWWVPLQQPILLDARKLGDRILLILQGSQGHDRGGFDLLIVANQGGSWRVDEIGEASMPADWEKRPLPSPSPIATSSPSGPYERDVLLYSTTEIDQPTVDIASSPSRCDAFAEAQKLTCGWFARQIGPYPFSNLPPDIDFTLAFINVSSSDIRVEIEGLGVTVEVPGLQTTAIVINGEPGDYLVLFYEGQSTSPAYADVITINAEDGDYARG